MKRYNLAIVGATGLVGQELIKMIESRRFPTASVRLFASDRSPGRKVFVNHREMQVEPTSPDSFRQTDLALFAAGAEVAKYYVPLAVESGAVVIDASAAFRTEPNVPLVVPEVNPEDVEKHKGIIANPNCSTVQLAVVLHPLNKVNRVKRVILSTYQSVSGGGLAAVEELTKQAKLVLDGQTAIPHVFPHQIAFNLLPEVDVFMDNGYTREEWKLAEETRRVMHADDLIVSATCVRVPVYTGHCQAVHIEFSAPMTPEEARRVLVKASGVKILDDPTVSLYPQPWSVAGSDDVFVGRIRQDTNNPAALAMWIVADNLRKGTALNAIQIAEEGIRRGSL
ncbi:MAG: aspartate-semialdehyde dehydrogenase [Chloroflexota bacterium]